MPVFGLSACLFWSFFPYLIKTVFPLTHGVPGEAHPGP